MAEPPDRRPRDPSEDETRFLPGDDAWPDEEETVVDRRRAAPPRREPAYEEERYEPRRQRAYDERAYEERRERRPAPPPPPPEGSRALWPWLLALLLLVLAGIAAFWLFARESEPRALTVPAVVRLPEENARDRLEREGFTVEVERAADDAPVGIVFAQTPGAGRRLPEGATVIIHVSEGPAATTVPNLVGLPVDRALERLEDADLEASREDVFSEEPPGTVVAQEPEAGAEADPGSTVAIEVSQGSGRVEVPDVVGLLVDEARAALAEQDLEANVFEVPSREPEGTVVAQNPRGGSEATRGDRVRLNVSGGP